MRDLAVVTVVEVVAETPSVTTLSFDRAFAFEPGQFVMVWVPGVDEVPMALSSPNSISVQRVGDATSALCRARTRRPSRRPRAVRPGLSRPAGTSSRSPAGSARPRSCRSPRAGGSRPSSSAPGPRPSSRSASRLGAVTDLRLATDDGSAGHHGYVADLLGDVDLASFDAVCVCGPEPMMAAVRDRLAGGRRARTGPSSPSTGT